MQESPPLPSPALPPSITPVSEVMQCGAGLLPQARNCIHALGCRMSQERGKQHPEVCVPSCCQSAQPRSAWGRFLGFFGQWGTARNRKASALCQECLLPTLHACNTGVKLPTQVTHGSSIPAEAPVQFFSPLSPRTSLCELCLTPAFHHHPCSEHPPPFFLGLPVPMACRSFILLGAAKIMGPGHVPELQGLEHISRCCSLITNKLIMREKRQPFLAGALSLMG